MLAARISHSLLVRFATVTGKKINAEAKMIGITPPAFSLSGK
jgi:hypothetical protein